MNRTSRGAATGPRLSILLLPLFFYCGSRDPVPPPGARVLTFQENRHSVRTKIYQSTLDGRIGKGEKVRYWFAMEEKASHRLNIRLLSESGKISFRLISGKGSGEGAKLCRGFADKAVTGCGVTGQRIGGNEYTIEVFETGITKPAPYRLFTGISGKKEIRFVNRGE